MSKYVKLVFRILLINLIPISVLVDFGGVELPPIIILNIVFSPLYLKILFNKAPKIQKSSPQIVKDTTIVVGWLLLNIPFIILGSMLRNRLRDEAPYKNVMIGLSVMFGLFVFSFPFFLIDLMFESIVVETSLTLFTISIYSFVFYYYALARPFYHTLKSLQSLRKETYHLIDK